GGAVRAGVLVCAPRRGADGAADGGALLRQQLLCKIRLFLARRRSLPAAAPTPVPTGRRADAGGGAVRAVLVATSTGGPRALEALPPQLGRRAGPPAFRAQPPPAGVARPAGGAPPPGPRRGR